MLSSSLACQVLLLMTMGCSGMAAPSMLAAKSPWAKTPSILALPLLILQLMSSTPIRFPIIQHSTGSRFAFLLMPGARCRRCLGALEAMTMKEFLRLQ